MEVSNIHAVQSFARRIDQDVRDLRRDLRRESIDTAAIDGMLARIETSSALIERACEAIAENLRSLAG